MADTETEHSNDAESSGHDDEAGDRQILVYSAPLARATNTAGLLELAKSDHAFDASIFDESPPFFWRTIPSNQNIDAYGTRMMPSSLKNFANDATDGVSFMPAHDIRDMPLGRSVAGNYFDGRTKGGPRMEGDFYTIPDLKLAKVGTNDLIRGMRSGIVHDVSIGFYGGEVRCSVCGDEWWSFFGMTFTECEHMPGLTYEKVDKEGKPTGERIVASGDVENARLAEVSAVYDGATPGASVIGILRAERMMDAGRLKPETARVLEAHYRIKIPGAQHNWAGADTARRAAASTTSEEEPVMSGKAGEGKEEKPAEVETVETAPKPAAVSAEVEAEVVEAATERGRKDGMQSVRVLLRDSGIIAKDETRDLAIVARELGVQIVEWRALADDAKQYRASLLEEALTEGKRAIDGFSEESYTGLLKDAPLDTIKRMRDDWKKVGDERLGNKGGRKTKDDDTSGKNGTVDFTAPAGVHRG